MNKHQKKGINLTETQRAWLAGLFEGEAAFSYTTTGHPRVVLQMTDLDIVKRVADLFNVKIHPRKIKKEHHKPSYQIAICKAQLVCDCLSQILPYMGERRSQKIIEILNYFQQRNIEPTIV